MAQTWQAIIGGITYALSGGNLAYRIAAYGTGLPPVRRLTQRSPQQHGHTDLGFRYDARQLRLVFFASLTSLSAADARRDDLYNVWKAAEGSVIKLKVTRDDGAVRQIDCHVTGVLDMPDDMQDRIGSSQRFVVTLECGDPMWYAPTLVSASMTLNDTTPLVYAGSADEYPLISISGPITNPVITNLSIDSGLVLDFTGITIADGTTYEIDTRFGYKTVKTSSGTNKISELSSDSDLAQWRLASRPTAKGGLVWQSRTTALNKYWHRVCYGSLFVALSLEDSGTGIMTSPDGVTWTARTSPVSGTGTNWYGIAYSGSIYAAVGQPLGPPQTYVMTSPDGITWTARTPSENNSWTGVTYGNGLFVAVASSGTNRVMTSPDGITWTARSAAAANGWTSVTYGNGLFVAVASSGTNRVMTSPDGITWTARSVSATLQGVAYGNGLFVAVGNSTVLTSANGIQWTARTAPSLAFQQVAYGNNIFVAVAGDGLATSYDGVTWTERDTPSTSSWETVIYGDGTLVALSGANYAISSSDGTNAISVAGSGTGANTEVTIMYYSRYVGI